MLFQRWSIRFHQEREGSSAHLQHPCEDFQARVVAGQAVVLVGVEDRDETDSDSADCRYLAGLLRNSVGVPGGSPGFPHLHDEACRLVIQRTLHPDASDCNSPGRVRLRSGARIAEVLVLLAAGLTWVDYLPRAIALRTYPLDLIDPLPLAAPWPTGHVGAVGVFCFCLTGILLLFAWARP